jgi:serine/threonine protein kinase
VKENENLKAKDVSEGDASYMAPELLSFNAKVTTKVDVFSFGISLIECFNNEGIKKLPKNGELWTRVREEDPSFFISFPFKDLANLIDKMTTKDVEKRFSIEDVLNNRYIQKLMNQDY